MRKLALVFLLLLISVCFALEHKCIQDSNAVLQRLAKAAKRRPVSLMHENTGKRLMSEQQESARPIRFKTSYLNIEDESKYCPKAGVQRSSFVDDVRRCKEEDVLTEEKRSILVNKLLPWATDFISERLHVNPLKGNLKFDTLSCSHDGLVLVNESLGTIGIPDTDFYIHLLAAPVEPGVVAWATACSVEDSSGIGYGRPVSGLININPAKIEWDEKNPDANNAMLRVIVHELFHALGFSPSLWDHSAKINCMATKETRRGRTVAVLRGPQTVQMARKYFNCSTLTGVELEEAGSEGTAGAHLKAKYHVDDMMAGWINPRMFASPITLAVFEDEGFYAVNWKKAEIPNWLHKAGCDAFYGACSGAFSETEVGSQSFCFNYKESGCSPFGTSLAYCDIRNFNKALPATFRYFINSRVGGKFPSMEYCPIFMDGAELSCLPEGEASQSDIALGMKFGSNSRCYKTDNDFAKTSYNVEREDNALSVRCFETDCYYKDGVLKSSFRPGDMKEWVNCSAEGQKIFMDKYGYNGHVVCPDPYFVCTGSIRPKQEDPRLKDLPLLPATPPVNEGLPTDTCMRGARHPYSPPAKRDPVDPLVKASAPPSWVIAAFTVVFIFLQS